MPGEEEPPPYEVLAAQVASLRRELAGAVAALERPVTGVECRQVFDLQPVRAEVTEHQLIERECGSGQRTKAAAPVQYGPRVAAIIVYLYAILVKGP